MDGNATAGRPSLAFRHIHAAFFVAACVYRHLLCTKVQHLTHTHIEGSRPHGSAYHMTAQSHTHGLMRLGGLPLHLFLQRSCGAAAAADLPHTWPVAVGVPFMVLGGHASKKWAGSCKLSSCRPAMQPCQVCIINCRRRDLTSSFATDSSFSASPVKCSALYAKAMPAAVPKYWLYSLLFTWPCSGRGRGGGVAHSTLTPYTRLPPPGGSNAPSRLLAAHCASREGGSSIMQRALRCTQSSPNR